VASTKAQRWWGVALVFVSLALAALTVVVATLKHPNTFAAAILQATTIVFSTVGAFVFAQASVRSAAEDLIRRQARSPFRRVRSIYQELGSLLKVLDLQSEKLLALRTGEGSGTLDYEYVDMTIQMLRQLITTQVGTADDALADWRDLVPEEVREIEDEGRRLRGGEGAA